jgi:hypothetical protein
MAAIYACVALFGIACVSEHIGWNVLATVG